MLGRPLLMVGGDRSVIFRSAATFTATVSRPAVLVGDLIFVLIPGATSSGTTLTTTSGSAWSKSALAQSTGGVPPGILFWKVLNATDVANSWGLSASEDGIVVRYDGRGATAATVKATQQNGGGQTSLTLTGFTPAGGTRGTIAVLVEGDGAATITSPANFTRRASASVSTVKYDFTDRTTGYSGGNVAFAFPAGSNSEIGWLVEVT